MAFATARALLCACLGVFAVADAAHAQQAGGTSSGYAVCISGTTYDELKEPIAFSYRLCHREAGQKLCTPATQSRLEAAPKGKIPFGLFGAGWSADYVRENNLQSMEHWIEITFDSSVRSGFQGTTYALTPAFYWDLSDPLQCRDANPATVFHFRRQGTDLDIYEGCHAKDRQC